VTMAGQPPSPKRYCAELPHCLLTRLPDCRDAADSHSTMWQCVSARACQVSLAGWLLEAALGTWELIAIVPTTQRRSSNFIVIGPHLNLPSQSGNFEYAKCVPCPRLGMIHVKNSVTLGALEIPAVFCRELMTSNSRSRSNDKFAIAPLIPKFVSACAVGAYQRRNRGPGAPRRTP
jgi:hypothetical protein